MTFFGILLNRYVLVYLDDILVFSSTLHEHTTHVREVPGRLIEDKLFGKLENCLFHVSRVQFLGDISPLGVQMDPAKKGHKGLAHPQELEADSALPGFCQFLTPLQFCRSPHYLLDRKGSKHGKMDS